MLICFPISRITKSVLVVSEDSGSERDLERYLFLRSISRILLFFFDKR